MSKGSFGSGIIGFILGVLTLGVALVFKSKRDSGKIGSSKFGGYLD